MLNLLFTLVELEAVIDAPQPTEMVFFGGKAYITSRTGEIWEVDLLHRRRRLWADLGNLITTSGLEQGLLGIAFSPWDHTAWVNYTDRKGNTVVARIPTDRYGKPDLNGLQVALYIRQPASNHNGGCIRFGPDSMLYIGTGDGGRAGDPWGNAQNLNSLLGKILRIDVRSLPYKIPTDNPIPPDKGRPEIWLWGLRNPWKFSFDRKTRDMWIADVGQDRWEEINRIPAGVRGKNLGWNYKEGFENYKPPRGKLPPLWDPLWVYDHSKGCSVTGGFVYRGKAISDLFGWYVFGDFCSGTIWALCADCDTPKVRTLLRSDLRISSFAEDEDGELYVLDFFEGKVYKLVPKRSPRR